MSMTEIAGQVHQLGNAWEEFKHVNERRLNEIERKGSADPLTTEQLNRINGALDSYRSRIGQVETALTRPHFGVEGKSLMSADVAEHKAAFCQYIRKGVEDGLSHLEQKALSVGSLPDGGYLVTPQMSEQFAKTAVEISPLRQIANVQIISTDSLDVIQDTASQAAGWTTETSSVNDSSTTQFGKKNIPAHEMYAQPKATQKLIDDASVNIEEWLTGKLVESFAALENAAFINGDGVNKPTGILSYPAGTSAGEIEQINSGASGQITEDGLIELFYSLKEDYAARAHFVMSRAAVQQARLLKESSTGQYLWNPGLSAGTPDVLLGAPVMQAAEMEAPDADSLSVAVGDFNAAYQIVDRQGVRILRDPFTDKPFVRFYATKRVGGDVVNFEALKLLKLSA